MRSVRNLPLPVKVVNPLHKLVLAAELNAGMWKRWNGSQRPTIDVGSRWLGRLPASARVVRETEHAKWAYSSRELAGVAGLFNWIRRHTKMEVVFVNDFALEKWGIDAVAFDTRRGRYMICEAKGTSTEFRAAGTYLKVTKTRGRQLSWRWIWGCLVECACDPATAAAFLALYEPVITRRAVTRLLSVSQLTPIGTGFRIEETKVWQERELARYSWLRERPPWTKQRRWLAELRKARSGGVDS